VLVVVGCWLGALYCWFTLIYVSIVNYRRDTILSQMGRLFCWGGSTSVSTTGTLETTWTSRSLQELIILSDSHASVPDDTEVVPPTSKKQVSLLKSQVSFLKSQVSFLKSQVSFLKSQVSFLKSQVSFLKSLLPPLSVLFKKDWTNYNNLS